MQGTETGVKNRLKKTRERSWSYKIKVAVETVRHQSHHLQFLWTEQQPERLAMHQGWQEETAPWEGEIFQTPCRWDTWKHSTRDSCHQPRAPSQQPFSKANNPVEKQALSEILHQFLIDGNINILNLNRDYKHFTPLVGVPGTHIKKFTSGHRIRAVGIRQVSQVAKKLLALFGKGGGGLGLAQDISSPKPRGTSARSKILQTLR